LKKNLYCFLFFLFLLNFSGISDALTQEKNGKTKAFLMSLAVPGLGQYYSGAKGYATFFLGIEIAVWGAYYYNDAMMKNSRDDYIAQAILHAGVNPSKYGSTFMNAVGTYDNAFEYNQHQLQYNTNPIIYSGEKTWSWDDKTSRYRFLNLREDELDYENNKKFFIAGVLANHFISALNASKIYDNKSKNLSIFSFSPTRDGLIATYTRSF